MSNFSPDKYSSNAIFAGSSRICFVAARVANWFSIFPSWCVYCENLIQLFTPLSQIHTQLYTHVLFTVYIFPMLPNSPSMIMISGVQLDNKEAELEIHQLNSSLA